MKKIFAVTSIFALFFTPVFGQEKQEQAAVSTTPTTVEEIDKAAKAINELAKDKATVAAYCEIIKEEDAVKDGDEAAALAVEQKLDAYLAGLEEDAQMAFDIDETTDPVSAEAQKLSVAFLDLEDACETSETSDG